MSKYRFQLEMLRKLRAAERDERRAALADAYRAEQVLAERFGALADEAAELRQRQRAALAAPYLDVNQLVDAQRYEMVLDADQHLLKEQSARLAVETERRRLAAVEADRAVRVLDKLDERRRAEHQKLQHRSEQMQLDEVASNRHRPLQTTQYH